MSGRRIELSICTYEGGGFDVMIVDKASGRELCFSGKQTLSNDDFSLAHDIAPACVWTEYERVTPEP